jgi:replicative DNA helicase
MSNMLRAALDYGRRQLPVLPLQTVDEHSRCTCGVADCDSPGKHPIGRLVPHGLKDATADESTITRWWTTAPNANIGIVCGWDGSGWLIVDVDVEGADAWHELERMHELPRTVEAFTGGGGQHVVFQRPPFFAVPSIGNSAGRLPDGVDVRCDGGYIVAPPSLHVSGRRYEWSVDGHPDDVSPAPLPEWLLDTIRNGGAPRIPRELGDEQPILEGTRDDTLASLAGSMRRRGLLAAEMLPTLLAVNERRCKPKLSEQQVAKIARSYERRAASDPIGRSTSVIVTHEHDARQLLSGDVVLDLPDTIPAVWGAGHRVPWAVGERLMLCAPQGTGKTTLAQRLALARCGIGARDALGMPVADDGRRVLYVAADRPAQALRSLRRMLAPDDRALLAERLLVWKGAPPVDVVSDPGSLLAWLTQLGDVGTVIVDSLKDVAPALGKDEVGSAIDHALRRVCDADVQVLALHHLRKAQGESRTSSSKPRSLDEVYGSTWLTGGSGAVLLLWGTPGDLVVELSTLKPIADPIGPLTLMLDHARGSIRVESVVELVDVLRVAGNDGLSALDAVKALELGGTERAAKERARRELNRLVEQGLAEREDGTRIIPTRWYTTQTSVHLACTPARDEDASARLGSVPDHAQVHDVHEDVSEHGVQVAPPLSPYGRGGEGERAPSGVHPSDDMAQAIIDRARELGVGDEVDEHGDAIGGAS